MSKVSSTNYPNYSSGNVSIGNSNASSGDANGILSSNYDMSDPEFAVYNYALSTLANILPGINTFDSGTQDSINAQVDAYKDNGIQNINELYNSSLLNLENDIVSRFGNLDNSIFNDNLDELESERSSAVSSFAQDVLAKQSGLESDELSKRYALVNLLSGLSDNIYNNALKTINTSLASSSASNNYYSNLYSSLLSNASKSNSSSNNLLSALLGPSAGSSISSLFSL